MFSGKISHESYNCTQFVNNDTLKHNKSRHGSTESIKCRVRVNWWPLNNGSNENRYMHAKVYIKWNEVKTIIRLYIQVNTLNVLTSRWRLFTKNTHSVSIKGFFVVFFSWNASGTAITNTLIARLSLSDIHTNTLHPCEIFKGERSSRLVPYGIFNLCL